MILTYPVDVLKTHLQAAPIDVKGAGTFSAVLDLMRRDGYNMLTRGVGARALKIGLGQLVNR